MAAAGVSHVVVGRCRGWRRWPPWTVTAVGGNRVLVDADAAGSDDHAIELLEGLAELLRNAKRQKSKHF